VYICRTKEVSQETKIQYRKQHLLKQVLVHDKHIMYMSHDLLYPNPTNTPDFLVLKINPEELVALSQQDFLSELMPLGRISSVSCCPGA
jgi:hypothetical protein